MRRVLKWTVPIDDRVHYVGAGKVVMVDTDDGNPHRLCIWTEEKGQGEVAPARKVQAFGTGHVLPVEPVHLGSVQVRTPFGPLVWHLYEMGAAA